MSLMYISRISGGEHCVQNMIGETASLECVLTLFSTPPKNRPLLRKVKHNNVQPQNERSDTPKLHPESFRAGSAYSHCVIDRKLLSLTRSQGGPDLRSFQHDLLQTSLV